jgi:hypothetical protein
MPKEFPKTEVLSTQLLLDEAHSLYEEVVKGHRPADEVIRTYSRISRELDASDIDLAFAIIDRIEELKNAEDDRLHGSDQARD